MAAGAALTVVMLAILFIAVVGLIVVAIIALPYIQNAVNEAIVFVETGVIIIENVGVAVYDEIETLLSGAKDFVLNVAGDVSSAVQTSVSTIYDSITSLGTEIYNTLLSIFNDIRNIALSIYDALTGFYEQFISPIIDVVVEIYDAVSGVVTTIICFFAQLVCCTLGVGCAIPSICNTSC